MAFKGLDTLEIKSKKRKNIVIISIVVSVLILLIWSVVSALLNVDSTKVYTGRAIDKDNNVDVMKNPEYKETWAIAMENRLDKQDKATEGLYDLVKNQQGSIVSDLNNSLNENNEINRAQFEALKKSTSANLKILETQIDSLADNTNNQIQQLKDSQKNLVLTGSKFKDGVIGNDLPTLKGDASTLPTIGDVKKMTKEEVERQLNKALSMLDDPKLADAVRKNKDLTTVDKYEFVSNKVKEDSINNSVTKSYQEGTKVVVPVKKGLTTMKIDTSFNKKILGAQEDINKDISGKKDETKFKPYHISTGFMKAYMVTGAYAPAFQEGSMEPLPVLFETEGNILTANHTSSNIEKCFLLGSAKGNMNSETADIKLVSINCLINGGKYRIEGGISGWVIGENGTPGLQGELLHKNGAWLARTFVSGFFETFSSALGGGQTSQLNLGGSTSSGGTTATVGTGSAISNNLLSAGSTGISNVFSKLGEYYLKMAQQIFPVIEVKGGRTVNILLIGGENLSVVDNNKMDINDINNVAGKISKEKSHNKNTFVSTNAFQKASINASDDTSNDSGVVSKVLKVKNNISEKIQNKQSSKGSGRDNNLPEPL